jgi:cytochrome c biogenesis protein CcmG/thiol:disulfide interchange protein DsbE
MKKLAMVIVAAVAMAQPLGAQESGIAVGSKAPAARIETLGGQSADLAQFIGKGPVMIEFWATWCENCKELEPTVLAMQKKYAGRVQFVGVAVSVNQSPELVKRYVEKHGLAGTQLYDRKGVAIDAYEVPATSFVVMINKAGKVVYTGLGGKQDLEAAVRRAM